MKAGQISLAVNDTPIALDNFVQRYIDNIVSAILSSLKDTGAIKSVDLTIEREQVSIVLNNAVVTLTPFASLIIRNTLVGMISSLHGVHTIASMQLNIKK